MKKTNCFETTLSLAFAEKITYKLWSHHKETEEETLLTIETNGNGDYVSEQYELVMIEAVEKNQFVIYGIKEV